MGFVTRRRGKWAGNLNLPFSRDVEASETAREVVVEAAGCDPDDTPRSGDGDNLIEQPVRQRVEVHIF